MKLAYLTSRYPATSHTFIRREVVGLRRLGVDVDTFSIQPASAAELSGHDDEGPATYNVLAQSLPTFAGAHLARLIRSPIAYLRTFARALSHRPPGLRGLALSVAHFAESVVLARELQRRQVTHLHNHFANSAATVGMLAAGLIDIPWSFTFHAHSETDYPAGVTLGRKIEAAATVICISWFGQSQCMRLVPSDQWSKMHIVRCGLLFDEMAAPLPASEREDKIICIARLSSEKAQSGLIQSFAEIAPEFPTLKLHLIGDGPDQQRLERVVAEAGLADRVILHGRLSEADTLAQLRSARLIVLPSFMEGLPVVLLEAAALEVPAIASRITGVPELISDGENGTLFTPSEWAELTVKMRAVLADPANATAMATAARRKVVAEFDVMKSAAQLKAIYAAVPALAAPKSA